MTIEEFTKVVEKIKSYTNYIYLHVKGEPLLHPDLKTLLNLCEKYEMFVNITTNGTLLKKQKEIIENSLRKAEKEVAIDRDKLYVYVLQFQNGVSEKDRYSNIKRIVDEFVETVLENRNGIGGKVLDVWQKELLLNGSVSNTCITLDKKQFSWIIVVKALENSLLENSFYNKFDISEVQTVQSYFSDVINNSTVRFEFLTRVLTDFNNFEPSDRSQKTVEFIDQCWENYGEEFSLKKLTPNTQEILIKSIMARIIYQATTINTMKVKKLI